MSEFGTGYSYCLGLFLAHEWKLYEYKAREKEQTDKDESPTGFSYGMMWFNGAADHLGDLVIPEKLPPEKQREIERFQRSCMKNRNDDYVALDDCQKALDEAKNFLLEWDLFNGIAAEKGDWQ